jgi:NTP pyrophosphatase (non-canonical NTP hydrolase)
MVKSFARTSFMKFSDFDKYQEECGKTAVYPKVGEKFVYPLLGLQGETGEVSEKIKKVFRDEGGKITPEKREEIKKELGDVLWYLAQLSKELGIKFSEVASSNLEKLASRKVRGKLHGSGDNR